MDVLVVGIGVVIVGIGVLVVGIGVLVVNLERYKRIDFSWRIASQ